MRILHAPSNIANQGWALAQGQKALGHDAQMWHYGANPFEFPCDRAVEFPPKRWTDIVGLIDEALEHFDIFHFHFARSLVPRQVGSIPGLWDLPLYRNCGKRVFFTFHGSDVRAKSKHLEIDPWSYYKFSDVASDEEDIAKRLNIIRTYANAFFVSSPIDLAMVPDAGFHPRAIIVEDWPFAGPGKNALPLVVHAPSSRGTKGTDFVLKAVAALEEKGVPFEFRLLEGMSHSDVKRAIQSCEVLVDNMLLGDYGVTGIEAMATGKTVVTRLDDIVTQTLGDVPVLPADPNTLATVLERAVTDKSLRDSLASRSREFVEKNHTPKSVARNLIEAYKEPPPPVALSWPDWAALGEFKREEKLESQIRDLQFALRSDRKRVILGGVRHGPFAVLGAKVDTILRKIVHRLRGLRSR